MFGTIKTASNVTKSGAIEVAWWAVLLVAWIGLDLAFAVLCVVLIWLDGRTRDPMSDKALAYRLTKWRKYDR